MESPILSSDSESASGFIAEDQNDQKFVEQELRALKVYSKQDGGDMNLAHPNALLRPMADDNNVSNRNINDSLKPPIFKR